MDWQAAIEREALTRIVQALFAMAGLLEAAGDGLPRDVYLAVLGPLRAAEAAARCLPEDASDPAAADRLRLRFAALSSAIANLIRRLSEPARDPIRRPAREVGQPLAGLKRRAGRPEEWRTDTS